MDSLTLVLHLTSGNRYQINGLTRLQAQNTVDTCRKAWSLAEADAAVTLVGSCRDLINAMQVERIELPEGVQ